MIGNFGLKSAILEKDMSQNRLRRPKKCYFRSYISESFPGPTHLPILLHIHLHPVVHTHDDALPLSHMLDGLMYSTMHSSKQYFE
jgi:hypothetical protein